MSDKKEMKWWQEDVWIKMNHATINSGSLSFFSVENKVVNGYLFNFKKWGNNEVLLRPHWESSFHLENWF